MKIPTLLLALLTGCFDAASDTTLSPCEQMVETLCTKACDCAQQDCYHFQDAWSVEYSSKAACEAAERSLWCPDTGTTMDYEACGAALDGASCGEDYEVIGLELPGACEEMVSY